MRQPDRLTPYSETSRRQTASRKGARSIYEDSAMQPAAPSRTGRSFGLFQGSLIVVLWCGLVASVAFNLQMPVVTAAIYLALVVLVGMQSRIFQALVSGWQIDGPFAMIILLSMLSLTVVLVAPFVGVFKIVKQLREKL